MLVEKKGIIEDGIVSFEVNEADVQDIDTYDDWKIAEMKYRLLQEMGEKNE